MAAPSASFPPTTVAGATATNPASADVMVDGGVLDSGTYEARIFVGASAAAAFSVQHRNAANSSNITTITLRAAAGQTAEYVLKYFLNDQERVRVVMAASLTGTAEASIQITRMV